MRSFLPEEICAAYLADPLRAPPPDLPWAMCDVQTLLHVLKRNKVPLIDLHKPEPSRMICDDASFQAACQVEAELHASLRSEYQAAKQAWTAQGITDILLKSAGLPPSFPYRSDNLDVLFQPHDVERVRSTLQALGYVELRNVEEPHKYLFRKFHAGRSVSAIHVHVHVGWMVSFLDEEKLWQRCRAAPDDAFVTTPDPTDALLITCAHYFYEDKRVTLQDVCKYAHCLRQDVDWDEVYRVATWRGWRDGLNVTVLFASSQEQALYGATSTPPEILRQAAAELPGWTRNQLQHRLGVDALDALSRGECKRQMLGTQELPLRIPFVFSMAFFYAKLLRDPTRSTARKFKDVALHTGYGTKLRLHIHSQPAMLVTVSGVDKSGKTTQVEALQMAFETCHLRVQHVWARGGSAMWLSRLTHLLKGSRRATRDATWVTTEERVWQRQKRFASAGMRWGWSWLTALELLLDYACQVTWPLLRGRVVLCDRYTFDALADWSAYFEEPADGRLATRVLRWLSPRPAIAFWLDVPPEMARTRSADPEPVQFLAEQRATYQRCVERYGLHRVDGTRPAAEVSDAVVREVLVNYFATYHTLLNSVFLKNPGQWR
jgi:thymidylate kinase